MRTRPSERSVIQGVAGLLLGLVLAPLLATITAGSAQAAAGTFCLPKADESSCISGTIGTRADPYPGVEVTLTKPDGTEETVTSADDGKWSFTVTEHGLLLGQRRRLGPAEGHQPDPAGGGPAG